MNAILVSVDMADLLSITLPYNRHHFDRVLVVTTKGSQDAVEADKHSAEVYATDAFYRHGASFNKWLALEEAFDACNYRKSWLCVMDVDVLWPKQLRFQPLQQQDSGDKGLAIFNRQEDSEGFLLRAGKLCTPRRRMLEDIGSLVEGNHVCLPPEDVWGKFPLHPQQQEWAGYSQVFHADDPHLGPAPWHQTDWRHAGGADSFFQAKWPTECKVRPPFECLHLGPAGANWLGRTMDYLDGSKPRGADLRRMQLREMLAARRGKQGMDRFNHERLPPHRPT